MLQRTSTAIKIETGIPLPPRKRGGARTFYPFAGMKVGDSFFLAGSASGVEAAASRYGKAHSTRYAARYVDGGCRVWRVA
jgi:hypothetical protein